MASQQETKKQGQNDCYEKGTALTLADGWEDSEFIPEGFILKLLLAGETFNSFLLDGISKKNLLLLFFSESKLIGKHLSSLYNTKTRQRNKNTITARRKGKASLWLLSGNTHNSFLKD